LLGLDAVRKEINLTVTGRMQVMSAIRAPERGVTVITGSFNWTASARSWNRENLLIVDDPVLARRFQEEFNRIWAATYAK
jgi:hypothetical protein